MFIWTCNNVCSTMVIGPLYYRSLCISTDMLIAFFHSADTRDINEERRNIVIEKIHQSAISIAKKRGVGLSEFKIVNQDPPALSDKSIIHAMEASSKELNLAHKLMISRAYHDSLFMARWERASHRLQSVCTHGFSFNKWLI